jgi:hypothetical protein
MPHRLRRALLSYQQLPRKRMPPFRRRLEGGAQRCKACPRSANTSTRQNTWCGLSSKSLGERRHAIEILFVTTVRADQMEWPSASTAARTAPPCCTSFAACVLPLIERRMDEYRRSHVRAVSSQLLAKPCSRALLSKCARSDGVSVRVFGRRPTHQSRPWRRPGILTIYFTDARGHEFEEVELFIEETKKA